MQHQPKRILAISGEPGDQNSTADSVADAPGPSSEWPVVTTVSPAVAPARVNSSATGTAPPTPPVDASVAALEPATAGLHGVQAEAPVTTNPQSPQLSAVALESSPGPLPPIETPEPTAAAQAPVLAPSKPLAVASGFILSVSAPELAKLADLAPAESPSSPPTSSHDLAPTA